MTDKPKRLFLCECACDAGHMPSYQEVYIVADDPKQAEELALQWMRGQKWKYDDYVKSVTCVAHQKAPGSVRPLVA